MQKQNQRIELLIKQRWQSFAMIIPGRRNVTIDNSSVEGYDYWQKEIYNFHKQCEKYRNLFDLRWYTGNKSSKVTEVLSVIIGERIALASVQYTAK